MKMGAACEHNSVGRQHDGIWGWSAGGTAQYAMQQPGLRYSQQGKQHSKATFVPMVASRHARAAPSDLAVSTSAASSDTLSPRRINRLSNRYWFRNCNSWGGIFNIQVDGATRPSRRFSSRPERGGGRCERKWGNLRRWEEKEVEGMRGEGRKKRRSKPRPQNSRD